MSFERTKATFGKAAAEIRSLGATWGMPLALGSAALVAVEANAYFNPPQVQAVQPAFAQKCDLDPDSIAEKFIREYAPSLRERPCDPNASVFEPLFD